MEKLHYFDSQLNKIDINKFELDTNRIKTLFSNQEKDPEWDNIVWFSGILSQHYKVGEKSRNGYKYDQKWRVFDNYKQLPIILRQHNDNYGGIWFAKKIWLDNDGNLAWLFYVDLDTLEPRNATQVQKGMVRWISTWAITIEAWFEDIEDWKILDNNEAKEKYWVEEIWKAYFWQSDQLIYTVVKQEMVENSLVSIWSNAKALATQVNSLKSQLEIEWQKIKDLYLNNTKMSEETKTTEETTEETETTTDTTTETTPEVKEIEKVGETEKTDVSDVAELTDKLAEANKLIDSLTAERDILKKKVDSLEKTTKDTLVKNTAFVNKWGDGSTMTMDEFMQKHGK